MKFDELHVWRDDLSKTTLSRRQSEPLQDEMVLVRVERFGLTANNITYGVVGEKIGYWNFFKAPEGWGIIPVWGFAEVIESRHAEIRTGERLYGYFPMGSHLVMAPAKLRPERLTDGAAHRAGLPPVYNTYARVEREPGYDRTLDDERMLLFPLYATSFCIYDFLLDNGWFGAEQAVIVSASSKTAIGVAYAMADDPSAPKAVGLTSRRNEAKVRDLGLYDAVATYDGLDAIDVSKPTLIIDMAGNEAVLSALDAKLGAAQAYCLQVGVTHYDAAADWSGKMSAKRSFFFAPSHIQKRAADWGPGAFEARALEFWRAAAKKSRDWLTIETVAGAAAVETVFHELRQGKISPDRGIIAAF